MRYAGLPLQFRGLLPGLALLWVLAVTATPAGAEEALWQVLTSPGHVAIMRHAHAPGTGDPADFTLGDCATQRNLDGKGRAQARAIGARFRDNGIAEAAVYSSRWCRSMDTARLLGLGEPDALPTLDSFFRDRSRGPAQNEGLRNWLAGQAMDEPLVLVTHQVNISALTGEPVSSGEIKVMRREGDGSLNLLGSIRTPHR